MAVNQDNRQAARQLSWFLGRIRHGPSTFGFPAVAQSLARSPVRTAELALPETSSDIHPPPSKPRSLPWACGVGRGTTTGWQVDLHPRTLDPSRRPGPAAARRRTQSSGVGRFPGASTRSVSVRLEPKDRLVARGDPALRQRASISQGPRRSRTGTSDRRHRLFVLHLSRPESRVPCGTRPTDPLAAVLTP